MVAVVCCELVLGSVLHDAVEHAAGEDPHACVICIFEQAPEVPSAVAGDVVAPGSSRRELPEAVTTPHLAARSTPKLARAPPAPHA